MARRGSPAARSSPARRDDHLLVRDGLQRPVLAHAVAVGHPAAEVAAALALVLLHLGDPLPDAVALGLGEGRGDGQEQLRQAVPGDVPAEVQQLPSGSGSTVPRRTRNGRGAKRWNGRWRPWGPVAASGGRCGPSCSSGAANGTRQTDEST